MLWLKQEQIMEIITDNKFRPTLSWYDLPKKFQKEFGYLDEVEKYDNRFVYYRKRYYDLHEFTVASEHLYPWQGVHAETFFSGILMLQDGGEVIMGRYCA